jgi:hypothetical protein
MFQILPTNNGDRILESHQRQLVDCSDPASETKRLSGYIGEFRFIWLATERTDWI